MSKQGMDSENEKTPVERLLEYAKSIEPRCPNCGGEIRWYAASGYGRLWIDADYGKCCGRALNRNGKEM